jgi:hypothetical protein
METVVAVTGPPKVDEPEAGVPKALMHVPTVTAAWVADTVCRKVVVGV